MACKYIYEGVTYQSKEDFIDKVIGSKMLAVGKSSFEQLTEIEEIEYDDLKHKFNHPGDGNDGIWSRKDEERFNYLQSKLTQDRNNVIKQNQFLHLLSRDNNWVTFFVKSIIQDSVKNGYEKVLFPRLDTIIQIESAGRYKSYDDAEKAMKDENWYETDKQLRKILDAALSRPKEEQNLEHILRLKEQIASHQPSLLNTAKFYEYELANRLDDIVGGNKNNRAKGIWALNQITDEYGNTWNEIEITPEASNEILFQKSNSYQSTASEKTIKKIKQFLSKNNIKIQELEKYAIEHNLNISNVNGIADVANKIIGIATGKMNEALPEEAFHIGYAILEMTNPELAKKLLSRVSKFKAYDEIFNEYKDIYLNDDGTTPDVLKIKKEAVAKILAEAENNASSPELTNPLLQEKEEYSPKSWWKQILAWIEGLYKKSNVQLFQEAADVILNTNIGNQEINNENDVYFQLNENDKKKLEKLDSAEQTLKKVWKEKEKDEEQAKDGEKNNWYEKLMNGEWKEVPNRITDRSKEFTDRVFKNKLFTPEQKKINNILQKYGIQGHGTIEDILNRMINPITHKKKDVIDERPEFSKIEGDDDFILYGALENYISDLLAQYPNSYFYPEKMIYSPKTKKGGEAGTIDLLIVTETEKGLQADVYDWKFIGNNDKNDDVAPYKYESYNRQLGGYKQILKEEYGISLFGKTRVVPFFSKINKIGQLKGISIASANPKDVEELKSLPIPAISERTANSELNILISRLEKAYNNLLKERVEEDLKTLKRDRLSVLRKTIRVMQTMENIYPLIGSMEVYASQVESLLKKISNPDVSILSEQERDDISDEIFDLSEFKGYFSNLTVELSSLFDDRESEEYKQLVQLQDKIRSLEYQLDKSKKTYIDKISESKGIFGILRPETIIRGAYKFLKSFDEYGNRAARLIVTLYNEATFKAQEASSETNNVLSEIISKINKEHGGKYDGILDKSKHTLIRKFSPEFKKQFETAIENGTIEDFIKENIKDLDVYIKEVEAVRDAKIAEIKARPDGPEYMEVYRNEEIESIKKQYNPFSPAKKNQIIYNHLKDKWWSDEFKHLNKPENKSLLEFYNEILKINKLAYESGYITYWEQFSFLPFMEKSLADKMASQGFKSIFSLPGDFINSLNKSSRAEFQYSEITGQKISVLPKPFTNSISNPSKEIGQAMILYSQAVSNYKELSEIDSQIKLILEVEKLKEHINTNYWGNAKFKEETGELDVLPGNEKNAETLYNFVEYLIYNNRYPLTQDNKLNFYKGVNLIKGAVNKIAGKEVLKPSEATPTSMVKLIDAINRAFQLKVLGGSPVAGAVNWFGGNLQALAQKSDYYDYNDFRKAQVKLRDMLQWGEKEASTFSQLANLFKPYTESESYDLFKKAASSRWKRWNFADVAMYFMRKPELKMQSANFEAILKNMMVDGENGKIVNITKYVKDKYPSRYSKEFSSEQRKEIENKIGAEVKELKEKKSILSSAIINKEGILEIPGFNMENKEEIQKLSILTKTLYRRLTGNASQTSINQAKLDIFTSSIMVFKNWIPKLWYTRFGALEAKNDPFNRDAYDVGRMKVFMNVPGTIWEKTRNIKNILKGTDEGLDLLDEFFERYAREYKEKTGEEFSMSKDAFNDMIKQNLSNQVRELTILVSMLGAMIALGFIEPPDEDKESKAALAIAVNTLDRFYSELTFFYSPDAFQQTLGKSIFPAIGLLDSIETFMSNFFSEISGKQITHWNKDSEDVREKAQPVKYGLRLIPVASSWLQYLTLANPELAKEMDIRPPIQH